MSQVPVRFLESGVLENGSQQQEKVLKSNEFAENCKVMNNITWDNLIYENC
jgi:hypothetical protein